MLRVISKQVVATFLAFITTLCAAEIQLLQTRIEIPEAGGVLGYLLLTETNRLHFVAPPLSRVFQHQQTISVTTSDGALQLSVILTTNVVSADNIQFLRQTAASRHPHTQSLQEGRCNSGCGTGFFFDLEQALGSQTSFTIRQAFLPRSGGAIEVTLRASTTEFHRRPFVFAQFLNSIELQALKPK